MSAPPFTLPQLPNIPGLPFFTPATSQAPPSPFSTNQQNVLQNFANGVVNVNPTLLTSGAQDLYNTEQTLQNSSLTLNQLIQELISVPNFLTPSTQTNLTNILNLLNAGNLSTLSTLLLNPGNYLSPIIVTGIGPTGAITTGILTASGKTTSTAQPITQAQIQTQLALSTNIPQSIVGRAGPGVISSTSIGGLNTGTTTSGVSPQTFYVPISAPLSTTFQAFIDALFGQSVGTNDVFSIIQNLYNWALPNTNNLQNFSTLIAAFNQGNLLSNSLISSAIPYRFPAQNGDTFSNIITETLTFLTQPGTVIAEIILTPTGSMSFSQNAYNFLNGQSGGPTGAAAQAFLRPIINTLFGTNPATGASVFPGTNPFDILFNFVSTSGGPTQWLTNLFPGASITGSSPAISVQQFISDALKNPNNIPADIAAILKPIVPNILINAFPSTTITSSSPQKLITDLLGPIAGGTITNVPFDVLNLVPMYVILGQSQNTNNNIGLGSFIQGFINNITSFSQNLFVGQHPSSNFIGFGDSVQFGNIPSGTTGGSVVNGWGSSVLPPGFPSGLNGALQGDLGAIFMLAAAASGDFNNAINNTKGSISNFLNINFVGATFSAGTALQQALSGGYFASNAIMMLTSLVAQLFASLTNILNVLGLPGIPTSPLGSGTNFNLPGMNGVL